MFEEKQKKYILKAQKTTFYLFLGSTGCSFQSVYFEVCAKIVNFHPILTKYGSFQSQGLGIYERNKKY